MLSFTSLFCSSVWVLQRLREEHQVDVPVETLEALVGREAYEALLAPAAELIGRRPRSATAFVRKYSAKTRVEIKPFKIRSTGPTQ